MRAIISIIALAIVAYAVLVLAVYIFQRKLQYAPSSEYIMPLEAGLHNVQEVLLTTHDAKTLVAWYAPAVANKPTILYFHGNAAGLIDRADRIRKYHAAGIGFFIPAYRSFAGSGGKPSETELIGDAHLAYQYLLKRGIKSEKIVLFGESLGTSIATQLAASVKVGALVLESPFTSAVDVGALIYPYLPVRLLMKDRYMSDQFIAKVKVPVLIVHGGEDQLVPVEMGKKIFALANSPKEFLLLPKAGHNDHDQYGLVEKIQYFIAKYVP